jgi:hypothetical protein
LVIVFSKKGAPLSPEGIFNVGYSSFAGPGRWRSKKLVPENYSKQAPRGERRHGGSNRREAFDNLHHPPQPVEAPRH